MFRAQGSLARHGCDAGAFAAFAEATRASYRDVPYHNFRHGVMARRGVGIAPRRAPGSRWVATVLP